MTKPSLSCNVRIRIQIRAKSKCLLFHLLRVRLSSRCLCAVAVNSFHIFSFVSQSWMHHFQRKICRVDFHYEIFITYFACNQSGLCVVADVWEYVFAAHRNTSSCFCVASVCQFGQWISSALARSRAVINNCSERMCEKPHGIMWIVKTFVASLRHCYGLYGTNLTAENLFFRLNSCEAKTMIRFSL